MGQIKELEEARAIFDLVYAGLHGGRQPHHSLFKNFMKNLKGDGWSIAIINPTEYDTDSIRQLNPHRISWQNETESAKAVGYQECGKTLLDMNFKQVIWQAGE